MKLSDFFPIVRSRESTRGEASRAIGAAPAGARPARTVPETFTPALRNARSSAAAARVAERPLGLRASVRAESGGHSSPRNPDFQPGASRRASHRVSSPTMLPVTRLMPAARTDRASRVMSPDASVGSPPPTRYSEPCTMPRARRLSDGRDGGVHARGAAQLRERRDGRHQLLVRGRDARPRALELVDRRAVEAHDRDRDGAAQATRRDEAGEGPRGCGLGRCGDGREHERDDDGEQAPRQSHDERRRRRPGCGSRSAASSGCWRCGSSPSSG